MTSEIEDRADELRSLASQCETVQEFAIKTGFHIATAHHANRELRLNLPILRSSGRAGKPREAQACPKSQAKAAKKGAGE